MEELDNGKSVNMCRNSVFRRIGRSVWYAKEETKLAAGDNVMEIQVTKGR